MSDDIITLRTNRICACVFLCSKNVSFLFPHALNIDRYNLYKQYLCRVNNF